jgi:hypothetical protein
MAASRSNRPSRLANGAAAALLRSPFHRLLSGSTLLITFTGRTSGASFTTPISYALTGDTLLCLTPSPWWKNLVAHPRVSVLVKRTTHIGRAEVIPPGSEETRDAIAEHIRVFLQLVRRDARFYRVRFDPDGRPNTDDIRRAAFRACAIRIYLDRQPEDLSRPDALSLQGGRPPMS